jgi:hypothetical protein
MLFVIGVKHQQFGIVAGLMMLIIALTSRLLIRRCYELFYVMHVFFLIAILITLYFHRPWIKTRTSVVVIICTGLSVLDKTTRIIKYACFTHRTTATVVPLANGSTRVTLNRSLPGAKAGSHAFLWLPRIRNPSEKGAETCSSSAPTPDHAPLLFYGTYRVFGLYIRHNQRCHPTCVQEARHNLKKLWSKNRFRELFRENGDLAVDLIEKLSGSIY